MYKVNSLQRLFIFASIFILLAVFPLFISHHSSAATEIKYIDESGDVAAIASTDCIKIKNEQSRNFYGDTLRSDAGTKFYQFSANIVYKNTLTIKNSVAIILADGCELVAQAGIVVNAGSELKIYAESLSDNMGKLITTGVSGCAGIGSSSGDSGKITICGGYITATAGENAAAIGGGMDSAGFVDIYNGKILANATGSADAIGNGANAVGGQVNIYGGSFASGDKVNFKVYGKSVAEGLGVGDSGDAVYPYKVSSEFYSEPEPVYNLNITSEDELNLGEDYSFKVDEFGVTTLEILSEKAMTISQTLEEKLADKIVVSLEDNTKSVDINLDGINISSFTVLCGRANINLCQNSKNYIDTISGVFAVNCATLSKNVDIQNYGEISANSMQGKIVLNSGKISAISLNLSNDDSLQVNGGLIDIDNISSANDYKNITINGGYFKSGILGEALADRGFVLNTAVDSFHIVLDASKIENVNELGEYKYGVYLINERVKNVSFDAANSTSVFYEKREYNLGEDIFVTAKFGNAKQEVTYKCLDLNGEEVEHLIDAGRYKIKAEVESGYCDSYYYIGGEKEFDFVINKANLTLSADDKTSVFGEKLQDLTYSVTSGKIFDGDKIDVALSKEEGTEVGEYKITLTATDKNYNILCKSGTYKITAAEFDMSKITFENKSYVFDGNEKTLQISGHLPDGVSVKYTQNTLRDVGSIKITASFVYDTANYSKIEDMQATLTITPANMSVKTLTPYTGVYNGKECGVVSNVALETFGGEKSQIKYSFNKQTYTENLVVKNAGVYKVYYRATAKNHEDLVGEFEVKITAAPLNIVAEDNTITYGESASVNGVKYLGFVNGETSLVLFGELEFSFNYEQFGDVGDYLITPSGLTSNNYDITFTSGNLHVDRAKVTIVAENKSSQYGKSLEDLTYTCGTIYNGDNLNISLRKEDGAHAGKYKIFVSASNDNYEITTVCGEYEITRANVSVKIDDAESVYGADIADLHWHITSGEIYNNDDLGILLVKEAGGCVGSYNISGTSANSNYNVTFVDGLYKITKATYNMQSVKFESKSFVYDGTEKNLLISGNLPTGVNVNYTNNSLLEVGEINATAEFVGDFENYYTVEPMCAVLTITKAKFAAPIGITKRDESVDGKCDGAILNLKPGMEVRIGQKRVSVTSSAIENLSVGEYYVRYAEDKNHYASDEVLIVIAAGEGLRVTFEFLDGSGKSDFDDNLSWGENVDLSDVVVEEREGFTFLGWSLTSDGANIVDEVVVEEDLTLYAIWQKNTNTNENKREVSVRDILIIVCIGIIFIALFITPIIVLGVKKRRKKFEKA